MQETLLEKYLNRRYVQTSVVIVLSFISLWTVELDSSALVALVVGALGVFSASEYADKKLTKE